MTLFSEKQLKQSGKITDTEIYVKNGTRLETANRVMKSCRTFRVRPLNRETAEFCLRQERLGLKRRTIIRKLYTRIRVCQKAEERRSV